MPKLFNLCAGLESQEAVCDMEAFRDQLDGENRCCDVTDFVLRGALFVRMPCVGALVGLAHHIATADRRPY